MGDGFSRIASRYQAISSVQKAGAHLLLGMIDIRPDDDILDLGCGTGNLARQLREYTRGKIVGVDPSPDMLREARARGGEVEYGQFGVDDLPYDAAFDVIVCNSVMQWFTDPPKALAAMRRALKPGGRIAVQAPATSEYGPNFLRAMRRVALDPRTRDTWAAFRSPWFFLESAEEYARLFENAGFAVRNCRLQSVLTKHTPAEAFDAYLSGAAEAYLNPRCYGVPLPPGYLDAVREIVRHSLAAEARPDGLVQLCINRIFIAATAPQ